MDGLEINKIAASILIAGLAMMVIGKVGTAVYHPEHNETRGFSVDAGSVQVASAGSDASAPAAPSAPTIDVAALVAGGNAANGATIFKKCATCHTSEKGGPNKVGPNLSGVVGRDVASHAGFEYSKAMSAHGGKWNVDSLYMFLKNPKPYVKGTKMAFAGIKEDKDVGDVISFLKSQ